MRASRYLGVQQSDGDDPATHWRFILPAAAALCIATGALLWFGYVATREWAQNSQVVAEGRAREAAALTAAAIDRDIGGAASMLLVPINWATLQKRPAHMLQNVARTFASFPYVESVLVWTSTTETRDGRMSVYNRAERMPEWTVHGAIDDPFPVVQIKDPPALRPVVDAIHAQVATSREFAGFEVGIGARRYQVVAHLLYDSAPPYRLLGCVAFTVNLEWVREEYFKPLLSQVEQIGQYRGSVSFAVEDDRATVVATSGNHVPDARARTRSFRLSFINLDLLGRPQRDQTAPMWRVRVQPHNQGVLASAGRTFSLLSLTAIASMLALLLTIRAVQARARVAAMKSDFVSAVTHDLKTPVSVICLVAETLSSGRYESIGSVQTYARMMSQEARRLSQSIDHLLTYARYSEGRAHMKSRLATLDLTDIVDEALDNFRIPLQDGAFDVAVEVPHGFLLQVDQKALIMALDTILDNAIKYSDQSRSLCISAAAHGGVVTLTVRDQGAGISPDDLKHVFDRFYRGRNATKTGSGLGLAIARRIVRHHDGDVEISSSEGVGTTVTLSLPLVT